MSKLGALVDTTEVMSSERKEVNSPDQTHLPVIIVPVLVKSLKRLAISFRHSRTQLSVKFSMK